MLNKLLRNPIKFLPLILWVLMLPAGNLRATDEIPPDSQTTTTVEEVAEETPEETTTTTTPEATTTTTTAPEPIWASAENRDFYFTFE